MLNKSLKLEDKIIIFFDLETGGLSPSKNPILTGTFLTYADGILENPLNVKIRVEDHERHTVDAVALERNGIDLDVHNRTALSRGEAISEIYDYYRFVQEKYKLRTPRGHPSRVRVGGYNVEFDLKFLFALEPRRFREVVSDYLPIDPLRTVNDLRLAGVIDLPNLKLETVCQHFGIPLENAHDAAHDIKATAHLFSVLMGKFSALKVLF